ncbi:hypothetical protein B0O99DRAFT_69725 [Bisporella sp. PMI_857]|nr:hypothetical protein B0O99DRAFT_69725 [Bisporella sp. PMI_857]
MYSEEARAASGFSATGSPIMQSARHLPVLVISHIGKYILKSHPHAFVFSRVVNLGAAEIRSRLLVMQDVSTTRLAVERFDVNDQEDKGVFFRIYRIPHLLLETIMSHYLCRFTIIRYLGFGKGNILLDGIYGVQRVEQMEDTFRIPSLVWIGIGHTVRLYVFGGHMAREEKEREGAFCEQAHGETHYLAV